MEKRFEKFRQNTQENKIVYLEKYKRKKAFEATYNGEKNRGFGKIHTKKMHSGQNTMAKNYIWGKMQWRKRRGFGKIHTKKMHSGQNTMEKNCICGKIQWRKASKFWQNTQENKIVYLEKYKRKKAFELTYNGEKSRGFGKIHTKKCILGKIQWRKIAFGVRYNGEKV